jgi:hypothetical protein
LQTLIYGRAEIFLRGHFPVFQGGFAILGAQNVVFGVVDDG